MSMGVSFLKILIMELLVVLEKAVPKSCNPCKQYLLSAIKAKLITWTQRYVYSNVMILSIRMFVCDNESEIRTFGGGGGDGALSNASVPTSASVFRMLCAVVTSAHWRKYIKG